MAFTLDLRNCRFVWQATPLADSLSRPSQAYTDACPFVQWADTSRGTPKQVACLAPAAPGTLASPWPAHMTEPRRPMTWSDEEIEAAIARAPVVERTGSREEMSVVFDPSDSSVVVAGQATWIETCKRTANAPLSFPYDTIEHCRRLANTAVAEIRKLDRDGKLVWATNLTTTCCGIQSFPGQGVAPLRLLLDSGGGLNGGASIVMHGFTSQALSPE